MEPKLYPGALVITGGIYVVHHESGHRPDTRVYLIEGFILPPCPECSVTFTLSKVIDFAKSVTMGR